MDVFSGKSNAKQELERAAYDQKPGQPFINITYDQNFTATGLQNYVAAAGLVRPARQIQLVSDVVHFKARHS